MVTFLLAAGTSIYNRALQSLFSLHIKAQYYFMRNELLCWRILRYSTFLPKRKMLRCRELINELT